MNVTGYSDCLCCYLHAILCPRECLSSHAICALWAIRFGKNYMKWQPWHLCKGYRKMMGNSMWGKPVCYHYWKILSVFWEVILFHFFFHPFLFFCNRKWPLKEYPFFNSVDNCANQIGIKYVLASFRKGSAN